MAVAVAGEVAVPVPVPVAPLVVVVILALLLVFQRLNQEAGVLLPSSPLLGTLRVSASNPFLHPSTVTVKVAFMHP